MRAPSSVEAFKTLEKNDLCATWPVHRMKFDSRTGRWKSYIIDFTSFDVGTTRLTLRFDLVPTDSAWDGPVHRKLILFLRDFNFVTNESYPDLLNETIREFLNSSFLDAEARVF
jgi:hypothetical protein